jgi:hypothetical protein
MESVLMLMLILKRLLWLRLMLMLVLEERLILILKRLLNLSQMLLMGVELGMGLWLGLGLAQWFWLGLAHWFWLVWRLMITVMVMGIALLMLVKLVLYQIFPERSSSTSTSKLNQLYSLFPEEQRNDVTTKLQRLKKVKKPQWFIWLKAIHYWLELVASAIQIQWDNLWLLSNQNINK